MTDEEIVNEPLEDDEEAPKPTPLPEGTEVPANDPTSDEEEG